MTITNTAAALSPVAWILGSSSVRLWGLTGGERLERQLRALGVARVVRGETAPTQGPVLLLRSDWLFDDRSLRIMIDSQATILQALRGGEAHVVAANVGAEQAGDARAAIEGASAAPGSLRALTVLDSATLQPTYVKKVLRSNRPFVLPISAEHVEVLEQHLFGESYKSVTDVVTKFVWPVPTRKTVRLCAKLGIRPNAVTSVSLAIVFAVMWLFSEGHFGVGLALAWLMTFLDTVDGKLARVTVTSTEAGHNFDHGIDLIHPPLWYTAWSYGLAGGSPDWSLSDPVLIAIFGGYAVGRIVERLFIRIIGKFSLFIWRPFDSFFRLITGRRNSNLLLLTVFAAVGRPDLGLEMVAWWTVLSTAIIATRVAQGVAWRVQKKKMVPWVSEAGSDLSVVPFYARSFMAKPSPAANLSD